MCRSCIDIVITIPIKRRGRCNDHACAFTGLPYTGVHAARQLIHRGPLQGKTSYRRAQCRRSPANLFGQNFSLATKYNLIKLCWVAKLRAETACAHKREHCASLRRLAPSTSWRRNPDGGGHIYRFPIDCSLHLSSNGCERLFDQITPSDHVTICFPSGYSLRFSIPTGCSKDAQFSDRMHACKTERSARPAHAGKNNCAESVNNVIGALCVH